MVRVLDRLDRQQARPLAALILCAVACSTIALVVGVLGTLTYSESFKSVAGLTLQHLRPLHTTFAVAWIYLGATTIVYFYLISQLGTPSRAFRLRLKLQLVLWGVAGAGTLVSLSRGVFSGREYMGAHWSWSVLIYLGWILFAWNFYSVVGFNLRGKPVFIYMWFTAFPLFLWAFAEGHGWHLALVGDYPLRDIAIQWKSYGPLVGSFNLLVYGSLGYLACCLTGNSRYAYSNTAFALFFVGVYNSFTNFGHHTYHLPQSLIVKWISCIASLTEAVIVLKYLLDIAALVRGPREARATPTSVHFLTRMTMYWSFFLIGTAVIISVPPLNTMIHGTHFVVAHAMGTMLGIDSMALWAAMFFVIRQMLPAGHSLARPLSMRPVFAVLNAALLFVLLLLATKGIINGYARYMGPVAAAPPRFLAMFPQMFMVGGTLLAAALLHVNTVWFLAVVPYVRKTAVAERGTGVERLRE